MWSLVFRWRWINIHTYFEVILFRCILIQVQSYAILYRNVKYTLILYFHCPNIYLNNLIRLIYIKGTVGITLRIEKGIFKDNRILKKRVHVFCLFYQTVTRSPANKTQNHYEILPLNLNYFQQSVTH